MLTPEQKAQIARENGAKSKGPVTEEGKEHSKRNAITHGHRATVLKLIVPPHSACLANEDRQAFYKLFDMLTAKYRPADETELTIIREIAEFQWKINRNKQLEAALYNRELMRQATRTPGSLPELRDLEISIAAQEALTGNRTIAELRKDTQTGLRAISHLQRRLAQLQKTWPGADPVPPTPAEERQLHLVQPDDDDRTNPEVSANPTESTKTFDVNGPVTPSVVKLYTDIFHPKTLELVSRQPIPEPKAA
jgi:hypothetical protein